MNKFFIKNKISLSRGFTLVELMVATSIFISIMLMAMGSLVVSNDTSKRAGQLRVSMDNVNFAMETMTRSIRMGNTYYCGSGIAPVSLTLGQDCTSGGDYLIFKPAENMKIDQKDIIIYRLNIDINGSSLQRCSSSSLSSCVDITSPDVNIDTLRFFVNGADNTTIGVQPSVYIIMRGSITIKGEKTSFALQTLASQRSTEIID